MPALPKKWVWMAGCVVLVGAAALFLLKVVSRSEAPASSQRTPAVTDTPEHELKELSMQLEKKPGHPPILMRMAQLEREQGHLDEAAGHLRELVKDDPSNQDAHLELGRVLYEKKDFNGAISETERVLQINPKQVDALYNMGAIYANLGNAPRARSYWAKAVEVNPEADSSKKARDGLTKLGGG